MAFEALLLRSALADVRWQSRSRHEGLRKAMEEVCVQVPLAIHRVGTSDSCSSIAQFNIIYIMRKSKGTRQNSLTLVNQWVGNKNN